MSGASDGAKASRGAAGAARAALAEQLAAHVPQDAAEAADLAEIRAFVDAHQAPFDRAIEHAHLTASAIVVDAAGQHVALGHHRKLDRWLQPGGHGEPRDSDALAVACREAHEETGIAGLQPHAQAPRPLDVDVHVIPARGDVAEHCHLDLRFLLVAPAGAEIVHRPEEHLALRWFTWEETATLPLDPSLQRTLCKARLMTPQQSPPEDQQLPQHF